jgi:GDPmannose 4,6-dehydratase
MKKALITGVTGQDGSLIAKYLLSNGYLVFGLHRTKSNISNLFDILDDPNLKLIQGDLMNEDLMKYILTNHRFDEIYNLASQSNIRLSYEEPVSTFKVTLLGTVMLMDLVKKHSPESKVFQAGSSSMFGNSADSDGLQRESTPFRPVSPYASSKLFAHNICTNYRENEGIFVVNGILYNHESPMDKRSPGIIKTIANKAVMIKKGIIDDFFIPNLNISIDFGHAQDYIKAMWLTLQQEKSTDYIISSGESYSIEYICEYIFNKLDLEYKKYIKTNQSLNSEFVSKGDASKIRNLGWSKNYNFNQLLDEIVEFENKNLINV